MAGRPPHKPTDEQRARVKDLASVGVPWKEIAPLIGIALPTLKKHYDAELRKGKWQANQKVAKSLFRKAMDGNVTACIFWLKTQAGWREADAAEITGTAEGLTIKLAVKGDETPTEDAKTDDDV